MKQSIRLGRVGGVPIGVHWSVAVIFGVVTWQLATIVFPNASGVGTHPAYWVAAVVTTTLFFASLLAHEGSHAVVARRHGVGVASITLWLFGGVAQLESEARDPKADFTVAAVGPGTSVVLVGAFAAAQVLLEQAGAHGLAVTVCTWLWQINLLLAAFNLIPAAPLDGGRILRAGLWRVTGDRTRAAVLAARAGMGFGALLIALGFTEFARRSPFGLWPLFLGWFLLMAARSEADAARRDHGIEGTEGTEGYTVGAVMTADPPVMPAAMTVSESLAGPVSRWHGREVAAVVGPTGWLQGVVTLGRIRAVPGDEQMTTRLGDIAEPIEAIPVGRPEEPMAALLARMEAAGGRPAVVLDTDNRLAGVVTLDDVARNGHRVVHPVAPVAPVV